MLDQSKLPSNVVAVTVPSTCKALVPLSTSVPISTFPAYSARRIVPSSSTSILGIPDTSFTENIVPVKVSDIEKSCPAEPLKDNVPPSNIVAVISEAWSGDTKSTSGTVIVPVKVSPDTFAFPGIEIAL